MEHVAYSEGYNVFLCNTEEDPEREGAVLQSPEEKRVDGLLLCSSRLDEAELQQAVTWHPAVVLVNRRLAGAPVCSVLLDDEAGGRRAKGYRAALEAAGQSYRADRVRPCRPSVEGGQEMTLDLLTTHPELSALFCYNDLVAVGALQACAELCPARWPSSATTTSRWPPWSRRR